MNVERDLVDVVTDSEELGATLERRRIRRAIEALPTANTDEIDYRRRILEAIEPVTTPQEGPSKSRLVLAEQPDLGPSSAAAAHALNGQSG